MCLTPITLRNPNYDSRIVKIEYKLKHHLRMTEDEKKLIGNNLANLHNRTITHIQVPCGHCDECRLVRSSEFVQRCSMEALNSHVYFFTLTYDNKHLPYCYFEFADENTGEVEKVQVPYASFKDITDMFKRIRTHQERGGLNIPFRYAVVSERGSKKHRPHFHGLLFIPNTYDPYVAEKHFTDLILKYYAVNVGTRKNPVYEPLFTKVVRFYNGRPSTNFDFHYVRPDDVTGVKNPFYYVSKYITKTDPYIPHLKESLKSYFEDCDLLESNINKDMVNFDVIWRLVNPKIVCSRCFGLGAQHNALDISTYLRRTIEFSYAKGYTVPKFYDKVNGKESNLCHYYKFVKSRVIDTYNKLYYKDSPEKIQPFYDACDAVMFYLNDTENEYVDTLFISEETYMQYVNRVNKFKRRINSISDPHHHLDDIDISNVQQLTIF